MISFEQDKETIIKNEIEKIVNSMIDSDFDIIKTYQINYLISFGNVSNVENIKLIDIGFDQVLKHFKSLKFIVDVELHDHPIKHYLNEYLIILHNPKITILDIMLSLINY